MSKKIGVLFSSGLDSTYLVWKNLKDGNEVVPIYIEISNNVTKTILEKNRIGLLLEKFREEFEIKIYDIEYVLTAGLTADENSLHFKQVPVWVMGMMFCQSMGLDEIQIGYVENDDAISYLKDIKKIYKSYKSIQDNLVPLKFPLMKMKKYMMAQELPEQYLKLIFSCEYAKIIGLESDDFIEYEACCKCAPCRTIINDNYYGLGEYPDSYTRNLLQKQINDLQNEGYKIINPEGEDCMESMCIAEPKFEPYQLNIEFNYGDILDVNKEDYKPMLNATVNE